MEEAVLSKLGDPNIRAPQLLLHDFRVEAASSPGFASLPDQHCSAKFSAAHNKKPSIVTPEK
jgi:hypothetical protein